MPVSSLTTTSVSFVNTPGPRSSAAEKASPSSPLSVPTVLPTVRPDDSFKASEAGQEPQSRGPAKPSAQTEEIPEASPTNIQIDPGSLSQNADSPSLPTQRLPPGLEPTEHDSPAVGSATGNVGLETDALTRTLASNEPPGLGAPNNKLADPVTPTINKLVDQVTRTRPAVDQVTPTNEPANPVAPTFNQPPDLVTPTFNQPAGLIASINEPADQVTPTLNHPTGLVLPKVVVHTLAVQESSQPAQVLQPVQASQPVQATSQFQSPGGSHDISPENLIGKDPGSFESSQAHNEPAPVFSTVPISQRLQTLLSIDSSVITAVSDGKFIIADQTILPGGPTVSVLGKAIYIPSADSNVIIDQSTVDLVPAPKAFTFGEQIATAAINGKFIIGSQTLVPGAAPITVSGIVVALDSSGTALLVKENGGTVQPGPLPTIPPLAIKGQTLVAGGPGITVDGTSVSLVPEGDSLVIGTKTDALVALATQTGLRRLIVDNLKGPRITTPLVIGSQALVPGGPGITVEGTSVSLVPKGDSLVIGTKTEALAALATQTGLGRLIVDNVRGPRITTQLVIGSQTLVPGGPVISLLGTSVSLVSGGSAIVIGTKTEPLNALATQTGVGSLIADALKSSKATAPLLIGGQTLSPGGSAVSLLGTPVSLPAQGSLIVIGTKTEALTALVTETGLGALIAGAFGGAVPGDRSAGDGSNITGSNHSTPGDFTYFTSAGRKMAGDRSLPSSSYALAVVVFIFALVL